LTFNSLGSYTDILIVSNGSFNSGSNGYALTFNGDTGSNYSTTYVFGDGGSASSAIASNASAISAARMDTTSGLGLTHIMNYRNTHAYKNVLTRGNNSGFTNVNAGMWRDTNAITSITASCPPGISYFVAGTMFTLYGIEAA
jgi:propanediol dehydratase large subunit